jgi:hypothetical protein
MIKLNSNEQLATIDRAALETATGGWLPVALAVGAAAVGVGAVVWNAGHDKGLQDRGNKSCPVPK